MITKIRIALAMISTLLMAAVAGAQEGVQLQSEYKVGQQVRYAITATVETSVTPADQIGLAASARRELSAIVTVITVSVEDGGEVRQEATVDSISFRSVVNGAEQQVNAADLVGKKLEFAFGPSGQLTKWSFPPPADKVGLAEIMAALTSRFSTGQLAVGQTWQAGGHGPFFSAFLSEIAKGAKTVYKLTAVSDSVASIEGATSIKQSGASVLTAKDGRTNINVVASGNGSSRLDFDIKAGRIIGGASESRIEGRLASVPPVPDGQKPQPRVGLLVETAKYSVKTVQ